LAIASVVIQVAQINSVTVTPAQEPAEYNTAGATVTIRARAPNYLEDFGVKNLKKLTVKRARQVVTNLSPFIGV
jgi:hypothetical protein